MTLLPRAEVFVYFLIWSSGVFISLYNLYLVGQVFDHEHHDDYHYDDFAKGWSLLGNRYQDKTDYEWNAWTKLTFTLLPWLLLNLLGAEFIRSQGWIKVLPLWYAAVTISNVTYTFNLMITLSFILQIYAFYVCVYFRNKTLVWIVSFIIRQYFKPEEWFSINEDDNYLIITSSIWMILRCVSFSLDDMETCGKDRSGRQHFVNSLTMLGYSLYLPTMFCGPFISFGQFHSGIKSNFRSWTIKRIKKIILSFARCVFWYFFTQLALHFIYVNAVLHRAHLVQSLFDWELAGLGIAMGHFFHLKYVVFYGLPSAWAAAENYSPPDPPCCVSTVHLYSYMWKHFDPGLHQFLVNYISIPAKKLLTTNKFLSNIISSMICFTFVFVWHGTELYVFIWVLFNFVAVTIESSVKAFLTLAKVEDIVSEMSPQNQRRLGCLLAAPLHYFSMVSNYFFIGCGTDVGYVYLHRFVYGSVKSNLIILFFLYGAAQTAVVVQAHVHMQKIRKKVTGQVPENDLLHVT